MSGTVLVLGATGTVGGGVRRGLLRDGVPVRGAARDPDGARARLGGDFVRFDLLGPATFGPALRGVDRVFLLARPGDDHADLVAAPLIDAMAAAGVRHVVNLTALDVETREDFALRKVERRLEASGMAWTHLRPNWFMQMLAGGSVAADVRATGSFHLPAADARISYIDAADIAEVAVRALAGPGHEGRAYALTGPESLDHDAIARVLSQAAGRPIRYVPIDEDAARTGLAHAGFPPAWVERLVGFYRLIRAGACAPVSDDVPAVLGRPATSLAAFAAANAAAWA